jgi:dihydrofolate reductase
LFHGARIALPDATKSATWTARRAPPSRCRLERSTTACEPSTRLAAGSKDVYLDGGDLVRQGLDAGLVDELCLTFLPMILGRGIRLWEGLQNRNDLRFEPPTTHGQGMVQVTARVLKRDLA